MVESESSSAAESQSFLRQHWNGWKEFWADRFSFLENYSRFTNRDKPLPSWSSSDVEEFIASDPVYGPTLKTAREAANYGAVGGVLGAVSTGAFAWKYSRSPHGAALALGAGAVFGWTFGHEIANHSLQLYKLDTMAAQVKFLEWWERKSQ
ncbi:PREDICTED: succinate dehydrogenase subunit 6, mitochondrial-like [Tarenaya hassleriana]|uniref:succinate dehydrogenase subunit 6, mitochondrial-like n=1 Tax=Tarenaya hassleriana TaxID=28532 RepID=UPI00053C22D0|nr:PREDICTED: succinate dehydrogenase subunit 6, mitochondrial-like [Tarenaya hassleriana]